MAKRQELQTLLEKLLGSRNVYFQEPSNVQMKYPCIVYERDSAQANFADNNPYGITKRYSVTIIDKDPDSEIPDKIARLPMSGFSRHFVSDNLHHDVYNLYF